MRELFLDYPSSGENKLQRLNSCCVSAALGTLCTFLGLSASQITAPSVWAGAGVELYLNSSSQGIFGSILLMTLVDKALQQPLCHSVWVSGNAPSHLLTVKIAQEIVLFSNISPQNVIFICITQDFAVLLRGIYCARFYLPVKHFLSGE